MVDSMLTVVCVKWGDKYSDEWVYKLRGMVARNLSMPHEFVCMTDKAVDGVDCIPCAPDLPSWWSKVGLFRPGILPGKKLYIDLDVIITAPIDGMVQFTDRLQAPDDFSYSLINPKQGLGPDMRRLLGGDGTVNSSVMLWADDDACDIWQQFQPEKMAEVHGDQNWITQCLWPDRLQLLPPGWVCSYKYHIMQGIPPSPIVVFHGNPKPDELSDGDPLRQLWAA